jgi:hypothetical protein
VRAVIITSLFLMIVAVGLLVAGIVKSSVVLLSAALACAAAGAVAVALGYRFGLGKVRADPTPLVGYDEMTAEQVIAVVGSGGLARDQLRAVHVYEVGHSRREPVLSTLETALGDLVGTA